MRFLTELKSKGAPFIAVAANRAEIPRSTITEWLRRGEDEPESIYGDFSRAVYKIRGDWMADKLEEILTATKDTPQQKLSQLQWVLTRLDRDVFDASGGKTPAAENPKPVKTAPAQKKHEAAPSHTDPDVRKAADDLSTPELDNAQDVN